MATVGPPLPPQLAPPKAMAEEGAAYIPVGSVKFVGEFPT